LLTVFDAVQSTIGEANFARENPDGFVASLPPQVISQKLFVQVHPTEAG
jgi:hypothetical protein